MSSLLAATSESALTIIKVLVTLIVFWLVLYFLNRSLEPRFDKVGTLPGIFTAAAFHITFLIALSASTATATIYVYIGMTMGVLFLYTLIFRRGGILQKLFWILVCFSFYVISNTATDALALALFYSPDSPAIPLYATICLAFLVLVLMGNFLRPITRKKMHTAKMSPSVMLILTLIPLISCTVLILFGEISDVSGGNVRSHATLQFVVALGMGVIVYCSFALFKNLYYQTRKEFRQQALIQQASLTKLHLDEISALYQETREWRHDYTNHLQVLMGYSERGQYDALAEYLNSLSKSLGKISYRFNVGSDLVNAILNAKAKRAESAGIALKVTGRIRSKDTALSATDFASLIGNVLDNAIEACQRITDPDTPLVIEMKITETKSGLKIYEKNPTDGKVKMSGSRLITSKAEPDHGIGSGMIDMIVEKYNGYIDRKIEGKEFEVFILLQVPSS